MPKVELKSSIDNSWSTDSFSDAIDNAAIGTLILLLQFTSTIRWLYLLSNSLPQEPIPLEKGDSNRVILFWVFYFVTIL